MNVNLNSKTSKRDFVKREKRSKLKERNMKRKLANNLASFKKRKVRSFQLWYSRLLIKLKSSKMKWYNVWSWPSELISDIREWRVVRKAMKEAEVIEKFKAFKYELRIDNISRIYTVINLPEEFWELSKRDMVWPWVLEQLREIDELLMSVRLNELVYPQVDPIPDTPAYLIVLSPSLESLSIWKFLRWLLNLGFVSLFLFLMNALIGKIFGITAINFIISLI